MVDWAVPHAAAPVRGAFEVPPSKSIHQRVLALAVLADGVSTVDARGPLGDDVEGFARSLSVLAARGVPPRGPVEGAFGPDGLGRGRDSRALDLGMNATGLRIAAALACLRPRGARTLLSGRPRLRARPHGPLLRALRALGGHAIRKPSGSLRVIGGGLSEGRVALGAGRSSQFATALAIAATRFGGVEIRTVGEPASSGYLDLTLDALAAFGVPGSRTAAGVRVPDAPPRAARVAVEPDASSAAVWWAAAALTGGSVVVPGLPPSSRQPDVALLDVLRRMGCSVATTPDGWARVDGPRGGLSGAGAVDLRGAPDLAPLVAALALRADGESRVVNAPHLRLKESDRIASVVRAVSALGGDAQERDDGFAVRGGRPRGGRVAASGDHRLVLAFGALGLAVPGVVVGGAEAASKSYPTLAADVARAARGGPGDAP
jgi:3-phosphoshikimate 1-carboxyvinyltransferase